MQDTTKMQDPVYRASNAKQIPSLMPLFLNMNAAEIRQLFLNLFNESPEFAAIINNAWQTWDAMRSMQEGEPEGTLEVVQTVSRANPQFWDDALKKLFGARFVDATPKEG